ncbi:hypothetical protein BN59_02080 [Legionella massiliensis]|uniref:Uncharacterized protein n=1 Tax=Legionella massiliensis TaxID=1034943 RepID=A0A078KTI3_9GAMM|nr:hypothetical protein [Legionella massiliensis]CDZ77790.1 hypothetical protein BN59_02080 [Legionella massiliensis]CEE13528.1 hypothetical protein BN1094_02080 [Legionella massiliensis]
MLDLDELIPGLLRPVLRFLGWFIIEVILESFIDRFVYPTGKRAFKIVSFGLCPVEKPSNLMKFMIYSTGIIILFLFLYLPFCILRALV